MKYKVLATDVDGTLTSKREGICLQALQAIRDLEGRGIPVILASARPFPILNILREYVGTSGAVICENGGHVDYKGESLKLGDNRFASVVLRRLEVIHGEKVRKAWTNAYNIVDLALVRSISPESILGVIEDFPSLRFIDSGFFYHVLPRDVDKGKGLMAAATMMGFDTADVVAIGDSQVDIELLEEAGFGVAVEDSSDDLKEVADLVTENPNGRGFCEAVGKLFPAHAFSL